MEIKVTIEADKLATAMHELALALQGHPVNKNNTADFEEIPDPEPQTPANITQPCQSQAAATVPYQPQTAVPVAQQPAAPTVMQQPVHPPVQQAAPVPTAQAPAYTLDQLAQAAAVLRDAGKLPQLQGLLQQFGIQSMQQLPPERYGEFATALRGMGAKI